MPFGDGTGPVGLGPMTGRAAGFCAGFGRPGFANPIPGSWFGFGSGAPYSRFYPWRGWGRRWRWWAPYRYSW